MMDRTKKWKLVKEIPAMIRAGDWREKVEDSRMSHDSEQLQRPSGKTVDPVVSKTKSIGGEGSVKLVGSNIDTFDTLNGYPYKRLRVWIQWVTPELAAEWLRTSAPNRNKRPRRVESIGRDMSGKKYVFTGSSIVFDEKNRLIDGQHRLQACVVAGESSSFRGFFSLIVAGVRSDKAMDAIDDVAVRTHGDRLRMQLSIENANASAAVALMLWQLASPERSSSWRKPSYSEVKASFLKNQAEIEWANGAIGGRIEPGISSGGAPILAAFAFARPVNPLLIDQAAVIYKSGEIPSDDHPMRRLRSVISASGPRIGNKNQSSQFSRHALTLVALAFLERVLVGSKKRGLPKPDVEVISRINALRVKIRK